MSATAPVTFVVDADAVGWIVFDDPEARVNIFNAATLDALDGAITDAEHSAPRALVIATGKERIFIAGADLAWLASLPDAATASALSRRGQRLFQRLAGFPASVVCAIHGACAGGGFELALACDWRIASDASVTQIGLPETSIGTIPGWGGSVRLPRLIGAKAALEHILKAQLVSAAESLSAGLVHEVVATTELRACAKSAALRLANDRPRRGEASPVDETAPGVFVELRRSVQLRTQGHQPALLAAIDVVEQTAGVPIEAALEVEARLFGEVTAGKTCKNLVRVFFLRDAAKKRTLAGWFPESRAKDAPAAPLKRVGVVGAGVMGSGIAHWLATRGFEVALREVDAATLERGLGVARRLFDDAVKRGRTSAGEANAALQRIAGTTRWDGFETCDVVIEAIVENIDAKRKLFAELARVVRPDAVLATNTSALPLESTTDDLARPERVVGIHFFNPVSRMPLVEIIVAPKTSVAAAERALTLVKALGKSPIICRSSPGFLVTRVLFFYLNEAVRLWESGIPAFELDTALRDFGWPMGPLRLIDEVGVDVTDFIFDEMAHYFPDRFVRSPACGRMLAAGLKGRKNGASRGFYRYDGGKEIANEVETRPLAGARNEERPRADLCDRLMRVMVEEAERCLAEGVVKSPDDVDFALLSGAGFPAFRGGLLHWAHRRAATP